MEKEIFIVGKRKAVVLIPSGFKGCLSSFTDFPIVYTHFPAEEAEAIFTLLQDIRAVIVAIDGVDWDGDLSPWPAPKAFRGGNDFTGGADAYLKELTDSIIPSVEEKLCFKPAYRSIVGYSMAGLFAVYALYQTELFHRAASVSGSLWYDGFMDFMKVNRPLKLPERVYFSLGDRESMTRNQRLARVEQCTLEAEKLLGSLGVRTQFEFNPGNHFMNATERIAKGLRWIL